MTPSDGSPARPHLTPAEWALVVVLALVNFTHILDFVIVMPLGDRLMRELSITPNQFAHIVSAYGLAAAVAGVLASLVVDRFDRRTVLLAAYAGFVVGTLCCGFAPDYETMLVARAATGAFGGVTASLIMTVIGDVFPDRHRGKAIGAVTSAFAVASVVGLPLGLLLANAFGRGVPFYAIAGASVAVGVVAGVRLPSMTRHRAGAGGPTARRFVAVLANANHWRSFAFTLLLVLGTFVIIPFLAPYLQANCGMLDTDIPVIYAVAGACTLVGMNAIGWAADRFGKRPVYLLMAGGSMVMTLVITRMPAVSLAAASAGCAAFMVTAAGRQVPAQAMMLWSADPKLRGAFTNLNSAVSHLATGLAPFISGALVTRPDPDGPLVGYDVAGGVAVGFAAVAVGISFLLKPPLKVPPGPGEPRASTGG